MTLTRFTRPLWGFPASFDQMSGLREEINRLFDTPFGAPEAGEYFNNWAPALDLREDKDSVVATLELPGVKKEDIDVSVHEGVLSIAGERKLPERGEGSVVHRTERFHGKFQRSVSLLRPVQLDGVKATYKDGILTVVLPKTDEAKPKQIQINVS